MVVKEFRIVASKTPTEAEPCPQIFESNIFAKNEVIARSIISRHMRTKHKIKASAATVLLVENIVEKNEDMKVDVYGVSYMYKSKKGLKHNGYKEIRSINRCLAVDRLIIDLKKNHKVDQCNIFIIDVKKVPLSEVTRPRTLEFCQDEIAFPTFKKIPNSKKWFAIQDENCFN